jgi:hypothetical protein
MRPMSLTTFMLLNIVWVLGCYACSKSLPTEPTVQAQQLERHYEPMHHNIPFSMKGREQTILWLCATQPRLVCDNDARRCQREEDHYAQTEPCPEVPIK